MVTRFYYEANNAAPVSPAFDGGWQDTASAVRRNAALTKSAATETLSGSLGGAAGDNDLVVQLVSPPLDGAQTISGSWTHILRARELSANDNINQRRWALKVVSNDGSTVRGTLRAFGTGGTTTEYGTALSGILMANLGSLTSVNALDGDRIVIETGVGESATGTTPQWEAVLGGSNSDHAVVNGDTTGTVAWVEFSQTLTFQAGATDLTVADANHAQAVDSVALTQTHALAVADAAQAQNADSVALTQTHQLAVADAHHAQSADSVALTQGQQLAVADATHAQAADGVALAQVHQLAVQDALHAQAADTLALSVGGIDLAVQDATHAQSADGLALTQTHQLAVQDAVHAQAADGLTLAVGGTTLTVEDALHAQYAPVLIVTQVHQLVVQNALQAQFADVVVLTEPEDWMPLVGDRAAIKVALDTVPNVTGHEYRPGTLRSGMGWPLLGFMERGPAQNFEITWHVYLMLPADERAASVWIDNHLSDLADALMPVGYVDRVEPVNLGGTEDQPIFGLMLTMRSE